MLNELLPTETLQQAQRYPSENFMDAARRHYGNVLRAKLAKVNQCGNPAIQELVDVVEFLVDTYEKGSAR